MCVTDFRMEMAGLGLFWAVEGGNWCFGGGFIGILSVVFLALIPLSALVVLGIPHSGCRKLVSEQLFYTYFNIDFLFCSRLRRSQ